MSRGTDVSHRASEDPGPRPGMRLELGAPIGCRDSELGELADVVLDPGSRRVTHLVVRPHHHELMSPRLVPVGLAEARGQDAGLLLRCTLREFDALDPIREYASVPLGPPRAGDPEWDVGKIDVVAPAVPMPMGTGETSYLTEPTMIYDRVPKDEIELGRASPVRSRDGHHLGHILALTVDGEWLLTSFVLVRRHLWMRRHLEVPATAVDGMGTDLVTLSLTRREASKLPAERPPDV
jgi:uncharacterized protein YrrD